MWEELQLYDAPQSNYTDRLVIKNIWSYIARDENQKPNWYLMFVPQCSLLCKNVHILHTNANFYVRKTSIKCIYAHRKIPEVRVNFTWNAHTCASLLSLLVGEYPF